jgi:hypothetical protein
MHNAGQLQLIRLQKDQLRDTLKQTDEVGATIATMKRFYGLTQQLTDQLRLTQCQAFFGVAQHNLERFAHTLRVGRGRFSSAPLLRLLAIGAALGVAAFGRDDVRCRRAVPDGKEDP